MPIDPVKKKEFEELVKKAETPVTVTLYQKLNELFGAGNQLFAMEFPSRGLNPADYEYNIEDCYSSVSKPYPVQEAEFMLSNQMFTPSPIVQGTNGEKLSTNYETLINNFIPKLASIQNFVLDQKKIRAWLLKTIKDEIDGVSVEQSRMAFAKDLYARYLKEKNEWEKNKNEQYDISKKEKNLESYAKWLSSEGLVRDEELNNLYNDAVVRGFYHEVLTLLGFLNVSSPAEALETTKQKMRVSKRRSLDGSSDVYSVNFQPSDWFNALKPNLNPKDLLSSQEHLLEEYKSKKKQLIKLKENLALLNAESTTTEDLKKLESDKKQAETLYKQNEVKMMNVYGKNTVDAFKAALNIYKNVNDAKAGLSKNKSLIEMFGNIAEEAAKGTADMFETQQQLLSSIKEYTDLMRKYAAAESRNFSFQISKYKQQIQLIESDLEYLEPLITGISKAENNEETESEGLLSEKDQPDNFTDIIINSASAKEIYSDTSKSSSSTSSIKTGFWFFSGSRSSSSSSSSSKVDDYSASESVEIGLRAKKISIERGGWFNPALLKMTKDFYCLSPNIKVNTGLTKNDVLNYFGENRKIPSKGLLPAFTSGFLVVKDVTIKIKTENSSSEIANSYMESSSRSGGGIFCFGCNSSSSSEEKSKSAYTSSNSDYVYIRIPGPQIIGWFMEFTELDETANYETLDPSIYDTNDNADCFVGAGASSNFANDFSSEKKFRDDVEEILNSLVED